MKNKFLFLVIAISVLFAKSQAQTFTQIFDSVFTHVSRADATTGILYERVLPFGNLTHYNSLVGNPDTSNYSHFLRAYNELFRATFQPSITMMPKDTLKQLVENDTSRIQIGMLHFRFNTFDTTVFRDKLYFDNDSVLWEDTFNTNSLYKENMLFVASPLTKVLTTLNASFTVNSLFYFDNTRELFRNVSIDFDDGLGFRLVSLNEVVRVNYLQDGIKTIKFKVSLRNGNVLLAYATMEVKTETPEGERYSGSLFYDDFSGSNAIKAKINLTNPYDGGHFQKLTGEVRVYYANSDKLLRKPLLIIDGFDPLDERRFDTNLAVGQKSLWEMLFYDDDYGQHLHLGLRLLDMGYDVVLLNLPDGGAYVEENALVCVEVINRLNEMLLQNNSDEQIVVVGPSMGGQIARYALTYMEQNPNANTNYGKHNTRLCISYDSPHQGANIAMGAQALIEHFADEDDDDDVSNIWKNKLCCHAALQMLIHHRKDTLQQIYNEYYSHLHNLNTQTNGYPSNTRNIAIANGSLNNVTCGIPYQISYEGLVTFGLGSYDFRTRNVVNSGAGNIFDFTVWILFVPIHKEVVFNNNFGQTSPDIAPGCLYNTFDQIESAVKDITGGFAITVHNVNNHCFMPITSTLDISGNMNYSTDISSRDLVAEGLTPFDSYAGVTDSNMYHVTFNQHLVDYMLNEIETYVQGPREVQLCQTPRPIYTLHLPQDSIPTDVTWLCSDNICIVRTSDPTVVNIVAMSVGEGWISAEVSTLKHRKRLANYPIHVSVNENNNLPVITTSDIPQQTMTISNEVLLPDTFCVGNGKTLTITNTGILHCSPGTRIIVRPGGKLIVDGGTLTSSCAGEMWQGIEVVGDRTKHQTAANQGTVILRNGATIENAHCAIRTGLEGNEWPTAGGIVQCSNSTFRNNRRAVSFYSYADTLASGNIGDNKSWFKDCTFTLNNDNLFLSQNMEFLNHVTLWDVKGVSFEGCTFNNSTTGNIPDRKHAIYAENAGFKVKTLCGSPFVACTCIDSPTARISSFTGFSTAVEACNAGSPYAVTIDEAEFENNGVGVSIQACNYATVTRCVFDLSDSPLYPRGNCGLALTTCTGYHVEGNTFTAHNATSPSRTGIRVVKSGYQNNNIYRNTLENLDYGIFVADTNASQRSGLCFTCNTFEDCGYGIYVDDEAIVSPYQGMQTKGANNVFTGSQTSSFYSLSPWTPTYYFTALQGYHLHSPVCVTLDSNNVGINLCTQTVCDEHGGNVNPVTNFAGVDMTADVAGNSGQGDADNAAVQMATSNYYAAVRGIMRDSVENLQTLAAWHSAAGIYADPYSLTEVATALGTSATAAPMAASLTADQSSVTQISQPELDNYAAFRALAASLRPNVNNPAVNWPAATPAQIAELQRIAEANTGRSSSMARGVLCFFFDICYGEEEGEMKGLLAETYHGTSLQDGTTGGLLVYPNPTDGTVTVEATGDSPIRNVTVLDMSGRVLAGVTHTPQSENSYICTLDLRHLDSGLYLIRALTADGKTVSGKVVRN